MCEKVIRRFSQCGQLLWFFSTKDVEKGFATSAAGLRTSSAGKNSSTEYVLERKKRNWHDDMLCGRKQGGILLLASSIVSLHSNIALSIWLVKWEITCLMEYEHLLLDVYVSVCVFMCRLFF